MRLFFLLSSLVFLAAVGLACGQDQPVPTATQPPTGLLAVSPEAANNTPLSSPATAASTPAGSSKASPVATAVDSSQPAIATPVVGADPVATATPGSAPTPASAPMTKQLVETYVLEGRSLSEADLEKFDLSDADLFNGHFQNADLSGANLGNARLMFAILRGADLSNANLKGADLRFADLTGANLSGANVEGADLREAILRDSNLSQVDLSEATLSAANLHGADLTDSNLSGSDWDASLCERIRNLGRFCTAEDLIRAGALLCDEGNSPFLLSPAMGSVHSRQFIVIDWSDCAGATEFELHIEAPGGWTVDNSFTASTYRHVISPLDPCCPWSWKVRARVEGRWGKWSATRTFNTVQTLPPGAPASPLPLVGSFLDGFVEQPSYTGDCIAPPGGSTCIGFKDGYIWLVDDLIQGRRATRVLYGVSIETELGGANEFHHILNTLSVKQAAR